MNYSDIQQSTPRLVVKFRIKDSGEEEFEWGMVGAMPLVSLIGAVTMVQNDLPGTTGGDCPVQALVIVWDTEYRVFHWFASKDVPVWAMVGMLELVKTTLVGTNMARHMVAQSGLLGPDGQPMRAR